MCGVLLGRWCMRTQTTCQPASSEPGRLLTQRQLGQMTRLQRLGLLAGWGSWAASRVGQQVVVVVVMLSVRRGCTRHLVGVQQQQGLVAMMMMMAAAAAAVTLVLRGSMALMRLMVLRQETLKRAALSRQATFTTGKAASCRTEG